MRASISPIWKNRWAITMPRSRITGRRSLSVPTSPTPTTIWGAPCRHWAASMRRWPATAWRCRPSCPRRTTTSPISWPGAASSSRRWRTIDRRWTSSPITRRPATTWAMRCVSSIASMTRWPHSPPRCASRPTTPPQAHFHLGLLKDRQDDLPAARASFERAIACRGDLVDAIYNLGVVLGRLLRPADAEQRYRQVLALDPDHVDAHINLSAILIDTERREEGRAHIDHAYTRQNVFTHSSAGAKRTVLILFDAGKGNMNLSYLFKRPANNIIDWMIAYAGEQQASQLPPYDLVFNAMGDADLTAGTEEPMRRFLAVCDQPLLNPTALVARTARDKLPALLDGLDHLLVPAVWRYADHTQWPAALADQLPLLVRPIYSHGGVGLTLVHGREELAQLQALRPGPVYVSRYIDYRSDDGWFRKYRMIFIDRKPYPYHLAISPNWMVHYYNAGMTELAWKLEEERVYLQDPGRVLGAAGMRAIEAIAARMDLDYAGIDFTLLPDGRILVFEANPTMLAHPEDPAGPLAHKNLSTQRIFDSFEALLERRCAA